MHMVFLGAPARDILVSFDLVIPLANVAGAASWTLTLNSSPALLGGSVFTQGGALAATARGGLVLANAAQWTLGGK